MKRGSVTRAQAILLGGYGIRLSIGLGTTAVLGRTLESDSFAFFTLIGTVFFMAHLLFDLGTGSVVVREIAREPDRERSLLEGMMGWRRLSGRVLAGGVLIWALVEEDPLRRWVLLASAIALSCLSPGALLPAFIVRQAQGGPETGRFAGNSVVLLGALLFRATGVAGPIYAVLIVVREVWNVLWVRFLALRLLAYRPRPGVRGKGLMAFMAMAWIPACATVFQSVYFYLDVFLVPVLRGEQELGAYAAAFRPINTLLVLPGLFMFPLLPVLTAAAKGDRARYSSLLRDSAGVLLGVGALGGVAGALLSRDLLTVLYGGRYLEGPLDATAALRWLSLAFALVFASAALSTGLLADGREKLLLKLALLGLAVNLVGNLVLIPIHGFTGAAFTTALTVFAVGTGSLLALARGLDWSGGGARKVSTLAPALLMAGILWFVQGPPWLRIACGVSLGSIGLWVLAYSPGARGLRRSLASAVQNKLGHPEPEVTA